MTINDIIVKDCLSCIAIRYPITLHDVEKIFMFKGSIDETIKSIEYNIKNGYEIGSLNIKPIK